jgi:hypothetical protein
MIKIILRAEDREHPERWVHLASFAYRFDALAYIDRLRGTPPSLVVRVNR